MLSPAGRPVAFQFRLSPSGSLAWTWRLTLPPSTLSCAPGLLIAGGSFCIGRRPLRGAVAILGVAAVEVLPATLDALMVRRTDLVVRATAVVAAAELTSAGLRCAEAVVRAVLVALAPRVRARAGVEVTDLHVGATAQPASGLTHQGFEVAELRVAARELVATPRAASVILSVADLVVLAVEVEPATRHAEPVVGAIAVHVAVRVAQAARGRAGPVDARVQALAVVVDLTPFDAGQVAADLSLTAVRGVTTAGHARQVLADVVGGAVQILPASGLTGQVLADGVGATVGVAAAAVLAQQILADGVGAAVGVAATAFLTQQVLADCVRAAVRVPSAAGDAAIVLADSCVTTVVVFATAWRADDANADLLSPAIHILTAPTHTAVIVTDLAVAAVRVVATAFDARQVEADQAELATGVLSAPLHAAVDLPVADLPEVTARVVVVAAQHALGVAAYAAGGDWSGSLHQPGGDEPGATVGSSQTRLGPMSRHLAMADGGTPVRGEM